MVPGDVSSAGRLLVATPTLEDPNFDRTVVYLLDHGSHGAVGVVINRPSDGEELDELRSWTIHLAAPGIVFLGGPVETDALIGIALAEGRNADAWGELRGGVGTVDLSLDPDETAEQLGEVRVFRGYSGWGSGQLEAEIAEGAWMLLDAEPGDLFTRNPDELWRRVVRRQGGSLAWIADAPYDLSLN